MKSNHNVVLEIRILQNDVSLVLLKTSELSLLHLAFILHMKTNEISNAAFGILYTYVKT